MRYMQLLFIFLLFLVSKEGRADGVGACGLGHIGQNIRSQLDGVHLKLVLSNCSYNSEINMDYKELLLLNGVNRVVRSAFILANNSDKTLSDQVMADLVEQSNRGGQVSMLLLANISYENAIDESSYGEIIKLYKKINQEGLEYAHFQLGRIFYDSPLKDITKSREHLFKASNAGVSRANYILGLIEYDDKNFKKAVRFFENAGNCHPKALFNLAVMYQKGEGVRRDQSTTLKYMERSAECGYVEAMTIIGRYLINDSNVSDKRNLRGQYFLEQAFSSGDLRAGFFLAGYRITENKKNNVKLTKDELIENMSMMKIVAESGNLAAIKIYVYQSFDFYEQYNHYYDKASFVHFLNVLVSQEDKGAVEIMEKITR